MKKLFLSIVGVVLCFLSCCSYTRQSDKNKRNNVPRVTFITSLYKGEKFIRGFLEDIVRQTIFSKCELIIINANSPENEEPVIREYMRIYPNIVYVRLEEDPGLYAVWNIGIEMAKAPYVTNANVDDKLRSDCHQIQADYLDEHPEIDLVYSDAFITHDYTERFDTTSSEHLRVGNIPCSLEELKKGSLPNCHPLWRKSLHEKHGYFEEWMKVCGDWEMWLRAVTQGAQFAYINEPLGLFYVNPNGLSSQFGGASYEEFFYVWHKYNEED